ILVRTNDRAVLFSERSRYNRNRSKKSKEARRKRLYLPKIALARTNAAAHMVRLTLRPPVALGPLEPAVVFVPGIVATGLPPQQSEEWTSCRDMSFSLW